MAAKPVPASAIQAAVNALAAAGGNVSAAARAIGVNRLTLIHHLREGERRGLRAAPESALREGVFKLAEARIAPPKWTIRAKKPHPHEVVPLLFGSDFQWGEVIRPEELDGVNGFDEKIARLRLKRLFERAIAICKEAMSPTYTYPGIVYLRGGDMVSGDIHQELRETNALSSIPAVLDLVKHEAAGISLLLEAFPHVHVVSVPGNHGRTTEKPAHKRHVESNYDTLSAYMLESHFAAAGETRVSFSTPESGDALFSIYGWNFLLTHGDRIGSRGGEGFIGPAATIARGHKKTIDYYASLNKRIDYILTGHFHTSIKLESGYANGCLSGYSEYARSFRIRPNRPSQWLLLVNANHGVFAPFEVYLEDRPIIDATEVMPWQT